MRTSTRVFFSQIHNGCEIPAHIGVYGRNLSVVNISGGTIQRDPIAFFVDFSAHFYRTGFIIDFYFTGSRYTAFTHTTGNYGCVGSHTATSSKDALRHAHASQIFGRGFDTYHDYFFPFFGPRLCVVGEEYDLSGCCTRRGRKSFGYDFNAFDGILVEYGVQ